MSSQHFGVLLVSGRLTHQENYALNLRADPRCTLVGLSDELDVSPERAFLNKQYAEDLGIHYWPDLDEALARDDVHIVSICADPERRGRIVARCADAGKHVYIDKPMTPFPGARRRRRRGGRTGGCTQPDVQFQPSGLGATGAPGRRVGRIGGTDGHPRR